MNRNNERIKKWQNSLRSEIPRSLLRGASIADTNSCSIPGKLLIWERTGNLHPLKLTPMPGVHQAVHLTGVSLRFTPAGDFHVRCKINIDKRNPLGYLYSYD